MMRFQSQLEWSSIANFLESMICTHRLTRYPFRPALAPPSAVTTGLAKLWRLYQDPFLQSLPRLDYLVPYVKTLSQN